MFKSIFRDAQLFRSMKQQENISVRQDGMENATAITFVTLAENGSIDEITASEHADLFTPWVEGVQYSVGQLREYMGVLYKCVQEHTSQADWTPDVAVSLWSKTIDPAEEYPEWSQPIGSHDAYNTGDKVTYNKKHWISTCDNNVWQPGVYGWNEVE